MENELLYRIALTKVDGIGDSLARNLISFCGSASAVFSEKRSALKKIPGIGSITADKIWQFKDFKSAEIEISHLAKHNITALYYMDKAYPKRLKDFDDSPLLLYTKGNADLNAQRMISVVGTRKSTLYGKMFVSELIAELKDYGVSVISGLAEGTDTNAHKACLKFGLPTIGVLGHGFSTIYPGANRQLAAEMLVDGALLSEFCFYTPGSKENFPKRNRIVAAMCDALIVVESGIKGGSLITAELANQYSKDVYALPGRFNETYSMGCNQLIHGHKAAIISSIPELIRDLGYDLKKSKPVFNTNLLNSLSTDEQAIVDLLKNGDMVIDELHFRTGISVSRLAFVLLNLEFNNLISALPGKVYRFNNFK